MKTNALVEVAKAMPEVNAATHRLSEVMKAHSLLIMESSRALVAIADEGTEAALEKADILLGSIADDVLLFSEEVAAEVPILTKNIGTIESNAPKFAAEIDSTSPFEKTAAVEFLDQLVRAIESSSNLIDGIEVFQQQIGGMKDVSPEMGRACDALIQALDDIRTVFNQNWFFLSRDGE